MGRAKFGQPRQLTSKQRERYMVEKRKLDADHREEVNAFYNSLIRLSGRTDGRRRRTTSLLPPSPFKQDTEKNRNLRRTVKRMHRQQFLYKRRQLLTRIRES